jgi:hypothetical protein
MDLIFCLVCAVCTGTSGVQVPGTFLPVPENAPPPPSVNKKKYEEKIESKWFIKLINKRGKMK